MRSRRFTRRSVAAAVFAAVVVGAGGWSGAAAFAVPGLVALFDRERGDRERDRGIGPPEAERGVEREACEYAGGEVGAEHVLGAFAGGGAGAEALADSLLGVGELGHDDDAGER